jgi:hypothetical protein
MSLLLNKLAQRKQFIQKNASLNEQKELLQSLADELEFIKMANINTIEDYRDFHYISTYTKSIAQNILGRKINKEELAKLSHVVFENRKYYPINTLENFSIAVKTASHMRKWWILPSGKVENVEFDHAETAAKLLEYDKIEEYKGISPSIVNIEAQDELFDIGAIRVVFYEQMLDFQLLNLTRDRFKMCQDFVMNQGVSCKIVGIDSQFGHKMVPVNEFMLMSYQEFQNILKAASFNINSSRAYWIAPDGKIINAEGSHGKKAIEILGFDKDYNYDKATDDFLNIGAIRITRYNNLIGFDCKFMDELHFERMIDFILDYNVSVDKVIIEQKGYNKEFTLNQFLSLSFPEFQNIIKIASNNKIAYPQDPSPRIPAQPYNVQKWIDTTKNIYVLVLKGHTEPEAFDILTNKWDKMEKLDFKHWLKFYQSNQHLAYKKADGNYIENSGTVIPINNLKAHLPGVPSRIPDFVRQDVQNIVDFENAEDEKRYREEQAKLMLAQKVQALIGRLNSAEKIFTSANFKNVLDSEYEPWLASLHDLKRKIQLAKIRNATLISDLIKLSGNRLMATGFIKAAKSMYCLAEHTEKLY